MNPAAISPDSDGTSDSPRLYSARFFQAFAAVVLFMTGTALQFHFGQYLGYLGHEVNVHGWVMSLSVIGTLLARLHIGRLIDFFGVRRTWVIGAVIVSVAVGLLPMTTRLPAIVALQTVATIARAAVLTSVAVFAAKLAPPQRRAESIGSLGLAGLLGIMVGPTVGDLIFSGGTDSIDPYRWFFGISAACALASGLIILPVKPSATSEESARERDTSNEAVGRSSVLSTAFRYWPGMVLLVGLVFQMVFCVQMFFLERLAEAREFSNVKVFFLVYSPTAIALRIIFRRLPERMGCGPTMILGMVLMAGGLLSLTGAHSGLGLLLPGFLMGAGHCFVFPSMVELAAARFPTNDRGMGTSVILGACDVGLLIGFASIGELIRWTGYSVTLSILAGLAVASALAYAIANSPGGAGRMP